jgi:hypothetical protein
VTTCLRFPGQVRYFLASRNLELFVIIGKWNLQIKLLVINF